MIDSRICASEPEHMSKGLLNLTAKNWPLLMRITDSRIYHFVHLHTKYISPYKFYLKYSYFNFCIIGDTVSAEEEAEVEACLAEHADLLASAVQTGMDALGFSAGGRRKRSISDHLMGNIERNGEFDIFTYEMAL